MLTARVRPGSPRGASLGSPNSPAHAPWTLHLETSLTLNQILPEDNSEGGRTAARVISPRKSLLVASAYLCNVNTSRVRPCSAPHSICVCTRGKGPSPCSRPRGSGHRVRVSVNGNEMYNSSGRGAVRSWEGWSLQNRETRLQRVRELSVIDGRIVLLLTF